jgi:hypothetical protein
MIELKPCAVVQWMDDAGWHHIGQVMDVVGPLLGEHELVREFHTGRLLLIKAAWLRPYPTEPIPQP